MVESFFYYDNKRFSYCVSGSGSAIMLVHGYTESKEIWFDLAKELSKTNTVIMPDLPGHGNSDIVENLSFNFMANLIDELVISLGIQKFAMIGHSMGGYLTACYANLFQSKLSGFGFFHSSAAGDSQEAMKNRLRTIDIIEKDHGDTFINMFVPDLFYEGNLDKYESEINKLKEAALKIEKQALIEAQKAMYSRGNHIELIAETNLPVLYIIGKNDKRANYNSLLAQAAIAKHAFVLLLSECGHMGFIEKFDDSLAIIKGFLLACEGSLESDALNLSKGLKV
ncbi:MAG: alpha/beta hydrolase [Bacteroidales bacterium]|nr:alpha/beta hydrolase [Bacteroidales bacterium]